MEKRWIAFFLFTFGMILLFESRVSQRRREAAMSQRAALEKAAAELQRSSRETSETLQGLIEAAAPVTRMAAPEAALRAPESQEEIAPPATLDILDAPSHEVLTSRMRVVFSETGGLPVRWELHHLNGKSPSGEPGKETAAAAKDVSRINLIPEERASRREYPLSLEGRQIEIFNEVPHAVEIREAEDGAQTVTLTSEERQGLRVIRTMTFAKDEYLTRFNVKIENVSDRRKRFDSEGVGLGIGWQGGFMQPQESSRAFGNVTGLVSRESGLLSEHLKRDSDPVLIQGPVAWAGIQRKFFLAALAPAPGGAAVAETALLTVRDRNITPAFERKGVDPPLSAILQQPPFELEPGAAAQFDYFLYTGPEERNLLQKADRASGLAEGKAPGLAATVFHNYWSVIRVLALLLLELLVWLEKSLGSYGLAIVALTLLVRLVTYPLTHKSLKIQAQTMAQQARLKPHIDKINEKYKDDAAARNRALMQLWKEHGVNPFGMVRGCVPVLLQMPIFIALYGLLDQAFELRGQAFLWIHDLSLPDRLFAFPGFSLPFLGDAFNLLPLLIGATQIITTRMSMSAATDPAQRQIMMIMPIMFVVFLYNFPSGLMLYWVISNVWQIGQQAFTNRIIRREQQQATAPAA